MLNKIVIFSFLSLVIFISDAAFSQDEAASGLLNRASQYHLGDKDQILMNVNVWGYIRRPGQYVVPRHTDLISLLSFAGGPIDGANLGKVRIIRAGEALAGDHSTNGNNGETGTDGGNGHVPIIEVNVKKYTELGTAKEIPILQAGDTVILPQTFGNKFESFLGLNS